MNYLPFWEVVGSSGRNKRTSPREGDTRVSLLRARSFLGLQA